MPFLHGGRERGGIEVLTPKGTAPTPRIPDGIGIRGEATRSKQRRFKSAVVVDASTATAGLPGQVQAHVVSAVSLHEGGVAGFLTAPFVDLRAQTAQGVLGAEVAHVQPALRLRVFGDISGSDRRTSSAVLEIPQAASTAREHGPIRRPCHSAHPESAPPRQYRHLSRCR